MIDQFIRAALWVAAFAIGAGIALCLALVALVGVAMAGTGTLMDDGRSRWYIRVTGIALAWLAVSAMLFGWFWVIGRPL